MREILDRLYRHYPELSGIDAEIRASVGILIHSFKSGGKLLLCGNGGSASDCEHIVGELMKGFTLPRPLPDQTRRAVVAAGGTDELASALQGALPAVSLTGHVALSTAFANDVDARYVYAQQLYGLARTGDVLLCVSTSGNAENVRNAAIVARSLGVEVIGLSGESGGKLRPLCDQCVCAPAVETYRVQEYHLPIYHAICEILERHFF